MSFIQEITQASSANTSGNGSSAAQNSNDIMGKQDFLTLLVTQLQNQDPLNPDDPTEFTAQLAQFSSLEQLFNMNESMDNLVTSNANSDRLSTLQTIGKNVVYQESDFEFDGNEVELGYQLDGTASEVKLNIQRNGITVAVLDGTELSEGNHFMTWDGMTELGVPAEPGEYKLVIQAKATEGETVAASPLLKSEVTGVDLGGDFGGTLLTRAGEVGFNNILGVYEIKDTTSESSDTSQEETDT